jgi:1,4-dihydroxy-2-naphthoate octaprenyltransferase
VQCVSESINLLRVQRFIWSSALIIAWLNISNDVFDADSGVDLEGRKPESVVNVLGWKKVKVKTLALLSLGHGLINLKSLLKNIRPDSYTFTTFLLNCSILLGYLYQGPPLRLSYLGLGEPLCFMSFGPFMTIALYLSIMPVYISTK